MVRTAGRIEETNVSELDDFLDSTLPRHIEADIALHNGDVTPRMRMWSRSDPVTVFGAFGPCVSGWAEVSRAFEWVASRFSGNTAYSFELVAGGVSGDMAYTVGYERHSTSIDGAAAEPKTLRVTQVYRREDGEWKVAHRHADERIPDPMAAPTGQ
jgi:ketosteroid isomerase-like protein